MVLAPQEAINIVGEKNNMNMTKGKRTKRSRPMSPLALTMSTSATEDGGSAMSEEWAAANSTTSEEEEDMAHCLILLAQGSVDNNNRNNSNNNNISSNGTTSYECKTCNKSFPSFQALGGHRTSHKKPKLNITLPEPKNSMIFSLLKDDYHHRQQQKCDQFNDDGMTLSLRIANSSSPCTNNTRKGNNKVKVHECSICGAEFSSGQALGGHMRRHRPIGMSSNLPSPSSNVMSVDGNAKDEKTTMKSMLSLDLNLPAPEEFVFASNEKTLIFSASSLVDCHY